MDTIFAVASGTPPAALAIMRVSGPAALRAAEALAGPLPARRRAGLRVLRDVSGDILDRALVLVFPQPDSATGEDVAELHLHGGRAVVDAVGHALGMIAGLRPAEAGEFTRRALLNGRIDLAEAEGLADLLSAETEQQRRAAIMMAEGQLSRQVRGWMRELSVLSAIVEARIEFAEEGDEPIFADDLHGRVAALQTAMHDAADQPAVDRIHDGIRVVVAGPPNSGKSSLVNALAERDVAIVTPVSGTTRDRIEAAVQRGGLAYVLTDTAGLTETNDLVEAIGVERARSAIDSADILLWTGSSDYPDHATRLRLHTKSDVARPDGPFDLATSIHDPASVQALWTAIAETARGLIPSGNASLMNKRQRAAVGLALASIRVEADDILLAENLRIAHVALARVLGVSATEAMLDELFGRFCIGK